MLSVSFAISSDALPGDIDKFKKYVETEYKRVYEVLKENKKAGEKISIPKDWSQVDFIFAINTISKNRRELITTTVKSTVTIKNFLSVATLKFRMGKWKSLFEKPQVKTGKVKSWVPEKGEGVVLKKREKWSTFTHNGVYFGEPYVRSGTGLLIDGKKIALKNLDDEEMFMHYAKKLVQESDNSNVAQYTSNLKFVKRYITDLKNMLNDKELWKVLPKPKKQSDIPAFNSVFDNMVEWVREQKDNPLSAAEKKEKKLLLDAKYKTAIVDGREEMISGYTIEPPGIFLGRGDDPTKGCIKHRVKPEEVTLNIGEDAKVPKPNIKGSNWGGVVHDHQSTWVAKWTERCKGKIKYVLLDATSKFKGQSNQAKYEKARYLSKIIDQIVESYEKFIISKDKIKRQIGTVVYLIDHFAFRVGNEKTKDEADTVGASTLKVENISFKDPKKEVTFDFLGKDSIHYHQSHIFDNEKAYENLKSFTKNKKKGDLIFDAISSSDINDYLKTFYSALSAKVFRTFRSSQKYYDVIHTESKKVKAGKNKINGLLQAEYTANESVAELCNHQKKVTTKARDALKNNKTKLKETKSELVQARKTLKEVKESGTEASITKAKKKIETLKTRISKLETQISQREANLSLSCTTSKLNYIDPRIVVSWAKSYDIDISKVYTAARQRETFQWAINTTDKNWDYYKTKIDLEPKSPPSSKKKLVPKKTSSQKSPSKRVVKKILSPSKKVSPKKSLNVFSKKVLSKKSPVSIKRRSPAVRG